MSDLLISVVNQLIEDGKLPDDIDMNAAIFYIEGLSIEDQDKLFEMVNS